MFLLQLSITRFEYNLYLLAITHRLPDFSCAVSDIKNYIKAMQLNSLKVEALTLSAINRPRKCAVVISRLLHTV